MLRTAIGRSGCSRARGRRLTAVLACRVLAFSLLDAEAQERRLARWGLVLSGAAAGPVRRIQWIERTAPAQGDELARWLHDERDPAVPLRGTPMIESYLELIGSTRGSRRSTRSWSPSRSTLDVSPTAATTDRHGL